MKNYTGEVGDMWQTTYALINYGDGSRCGWCKKLVSEIGEAFIDEHLDHHVEEDKLSK